MGLWTGHSTREVGDNVGHLFGPGLVCLLSADPTLSHSPAAVVLPSGAVCAASVDSVSRGWAGGATLRSAFVVLPPALSVRSACSLVSPIWALVAGWTHCKNVHCPLSLPLTHSMVGVGAACVNAPNGWRRSADCLPRQMTDDLSGGEIYD